MVLPFTYVNPTTGLIGPAKYVMISQEGGGVEAGKWDAYLGKREVGESPRQAAAREGAEESCEMFGSQSELYQNIESMKGSNALFLLDVDKFMTPKQVMDDCSAAAYLKRKKLSKYRAGRFQEKTQAKWVKLADLVNACANNHGVLKQNGGNDLVMRGYFCNMMARQQKYINKPIKAQKIAKPAVANTADSLNVKEVTSSRSLATVGKVAKLWEKSALKKVQHYSKKYGADHEKTQVATAAHETALALQAGLPNSKDIKNGKCAVFAAYDSKRRIQGLALVNLKGANGHAVDLEALAVNPERIATIGKRPVKGTGTAVVKAVAAKILKGKGKKELGVFSEASSVAFYEKLGFKVDGSASGSSWTGMVLDQQGLANLVQK